MTRPLKVRACDRQLLMTRVDAGEFHFRDLIADHPPCWAIRSPGGRALAGRPYTALLVVVKLGRLH
jgi:hypothetical protein